MPTEEELSRYGLDDRDRREQRSYAEMERHKSFAKSDSQLADERAEDDRRQQERHRSRRVMSYREAWEADKEKR